MALTAQIQTLIETPDNRELVRDQIAAILKVEADSQRALAQAAGKDPELWRLRVYSEKAEPWAAFSDSKKSPIINVWVENSTADKAGSDPVNHSKWQTTYHIDCYGFGVTQGTDQGHDAADKMAVFEAERALRQCRNILASSYYTYLGFPQGAFLPQGQKQVVWGRWISNITSFQPPQSERPVERVQAIRLDLEVTYSEFSPQYVAQPLEILALALTKSDDGEWLDAEWNTAAPEPEPEP